ncbi:DUF397 domain-containing protein [Actinocorallia sp. A-T 12471]|uniref:DUF397 domain-containing protein n=1 Tax=Actinocorallia sp. A-T 12471 TaxID=3089813 RepID=UPI0029D15001|nr:DUF397 domain-containing protein [Actinocorallia sp. A-T 12471]MDX6743677.1 DUF397 domain-containing protein [Actinocorallia sp. A-T 12471]
MNREQFAAWRKSTYSDDDANCVEIALGNRGSIGVRDSKNPTHPALVFTPSAVTRLARSIKADKHL